MSLNPDFLNGLAGQINSVNTCEALQEATDTALQALRDQSAAITAQLEKLLPIKELMEAELDSLDKIVAFVPKIRDVIIGPMYANYLKYTEEAALVLSAIANLENAITSKAGTLTNCTITIPPPI